RGLAPRQFAESLIEGNAAVDGQMGITFDQNAVCMEIVRGECTAHAQPEYLQLSIGLERQGFAGLEFANFHTHSFPVSEGIAHSSLLIKSVRSNPASANTFSRTLTSGIPH